MKITYYVIIKPRRCLSITFNFFIINDFRIQDAHWFNIYIANRTYLEKDFNDSVSGCEVSDEAGPVQGDVAAPRTVVGALLRQQGRHLVLNTIQICKKKKKHYFESKPHKPLSSCSVIFDSSLISFLICSIFAAD